MSSVQVDIPITLSLKIGGGLSEQPTSYDKATKAEAHYRRPEDEPPSIPLQPTSRMDHMETPVGARSVEGTYQRCGTCDHYDGYRACEIVAGVIEPEFVCDWWTAEADVA